MKLGIEFAERHEAELRAFLYKAMDHSYGSEEPPVVREDGCHEINYREGDWEYTDSWYGGQPYAGSIVVRYRGKGCWFMSYWGQTVPAAPKKPIFDCLKEALKERNTLYPYRGPEYYRAKNGYLYMNRWSDVWQTHSYGMQGKEVIADEKNQELYEMNYSGGFVDLF